MKDMIRPTRFVHLALSLLAVAALAAACGGSQSGGKSSPAPSTPAPSAHGPLANADLTVYDLDSGGLTGSAALAEAGYAERYPEGTDALDHLAEADYIIEHGLPKAVDLNDVKSGTPGSQDVGATVIWEPNGRRDTLLPPGNHGERIYNLVVDLDPYLKGGDAVAYVSFLSRAEGDALDANNLTATPATIPNQVYTFKLDKATAAALLDVFYVKGAAPTDSPEPTDEELPTDEPE
jgi:hypothetical protein